MLFCKMLTATAYNLLRYLYPNGLLVLFITYANRNTWCSFISSSWLLLTTVTVVLGIRVQTFFSVLQSTKCVMLSAYINHCGVECSAYCLEDWFSFRCCQVPCMWKDSKTTLSLRLLEDIWSMKWGGMKLVAVNWELPSQWDLLKKKKKKNPQQQTDGGEINRTATLLGPCVFTWLLWALATQQGPRAGCLQFSTYLGKRHRTQPGQFIGSGGKEPSVRRSVEVWEEVVIKITDISWQNNM